LPWTQSFFERFQKLKGYDIRPFLATFLLPRGARITDEQARAKADYWDVFSILFAESFFKVQADWCAANHLEYQVHLNHEEAELELVHSEGDFFRDMRAVQVRHRHDAPSDLDGYNLRLSTPGFLGLSRLRQAQSLYRELCLCESNAGQAEIRYILNEQFVRGVNMAELMYFPSSNAAAGHEQHSWRTRNSAFMRYVED